ncbi:MAG TPA: HEAT repeat domain-containing protein [Acidimicrobiales bacterium]|nr:HEAT repeat domain-containing protein [Acidimicrobiales bacterium]
MSPERDAGAGPNSVRERRRAILLAGHKGNPEPARAALAGEDPALRIAALGALARAGALGAEDLDSCLRDPDPGVRRRAAELSAGSAQEGTTGALLGLLADPDPLVAEMAAWALGEGTPSGEVVTALSQVAGDHEDPLCREAAVAALGALGDPGGLPAILEATSDKPAIRRRAVIALAPFEGPEVDAALVRARSDRDWQVRQAAEDQEGR